MHITSFLLRLATLLICTHDALACQGRAKLAAAAGKPKAQRLDQSACGMWQNKKAREQLAPGTPAGSREAVAR